MSRWHSKLRFTAMWALVAVSAILLIGWILLWKAHRPQSSSSVVRPVATRMPEEEHAPSVAAGPSRPASTLRPEAVPRSKLPDEVEVCGLGLIKRSEQGADGGRALAAQAEPQSLMRWLAQTAQSADERTRAVALRTSAEFLAAHDPDAARDSMGQFLRLASVTRDPVVYAMAVQSCRAFGPRATVTQCQLISADQWTRVDPDNAIAWLHAAEAARARGDFAARDEAWYRASRAKVLRDYAQVPTAALLNADTVGLSAAQKTLLAVHVIGVQAAWTIPGIGLTSDTCSPQAVLNANRHQICSALAELFATQPDSIFQISIAHQLGERVGWPKARLDALRDKGTALYAALRKEATADDPLSCKALNAARERATASVEHGEVAALLTRYSATPPPPR